MRAYRAYGRKQGHAYRRLANDALFTRRKLGLTTETKCEEAIQALNPPPPPTPAST